MPLPKIEDARNLDDEEVAAEILAAKQKLFELRFQQATRRLEKNHEFKHTRHRLAQLMTIERERQLAANQPQLEVAPVSPVQDQSPAAQEEE